MFHAQQFRGWGGLRNALWKNRPAETEAGVAGLLEFETVKTGYLHGHKRPELISPDNWNSTSPFCNGRMHAGCRWTCSTTTGPTLSCIRNGRSFFGTSSLKPLIFWGQNDIFFNSRGGEAYLGDLPRAEMRRLDSGHFVLEDCLDEIAGSILRFYAEEVATGSVAKCKTA